MSLRIRPADRADLPRLTEIYNHYVIHTPVTFDLEPYTVERRAAWFEQFSLTGRYRLVVAEENGIVMGYAGTARFRVKPAYDTTVETTVYSSPEAVGKGIGRKLYAGLFEALAGENINRIVGGYTLPNDGSAKLHEFFGFKNVGIFTEVGYKFGKYWDVQWTERPLRVPAISTQPSAFSPEHPRMPNEHLETQRNGGTRGRIPQSQAQEWAKPELNPDPQTGSITYCPLLTPFLRVSKVCCCRARAKAEC